MFSDFVHFASPEIKNEFPSDLSAFIHSGKVVKHNPVRDVFKTDGSFISFFQIPHRRCIAFDRLRKNLAALNDISRIAVSPLFELEG